MVEKVLEKILLVITSNARLAFALAIASWTLFFFSHVTQNTLLISNASLIEIVAFGSSAWFISLIFYDTLKRTGPMIKSKYKKYTFQKAIKNLSIEEKSCLYPFFKNKTARYFFPRNFSTAHSLCNKGFLIHEKTDNRNTINGRKPTDYFHIHPLVYDLIERSPEFFKEGQVFYEGRMTSEFDFR